MRGFLLASLFVLLCGSMEAQMLCESPQGGYRECRIGTAGVLGLVGELSEGRCVEGVTWGTVSTGVVWVDKGCRAEFIVGARFDPKKVIEPLDNLVTCESANGKRTQCTADTSGGVRIVRPLSDAACGYGRQWGYDAKGIWVNGNCRAEFAV